MIQWWRHTVFYEIYMMSFCDGNRDGVGDIPGIISKLPYLKKLGVGGIWLTPFYPSPKVDNGYDVSDYCNVDPDYGTIEDFKRLVAEAHKLGIKVIADMVLNHTSTRHPWFSEASLSRDSLKRDWYIWKDPLEGREPNNWESFFGGSAWEYDRNSGQYYYHSFAREQADLNWRNPQVKEAVYRILDFWLETGIDGFRFDVINNLSVSETMENNPAAGNGGQLHVNDVNQPGIYEVLAQICRQVREKKPDVFLVGEISSDQLERIHSYTLLDGLDTTFNFNLGSREQFRFGEILEEMRRMQALYGPSESPTVFFGSHDMRRFPDRFSFSEGKVKCLLTLMMTCKGIPFLYFGDELGLKSQILSSIEEAKDVQGILAYEIAIKRGKSETEAIKVLNEKSRDVSRNPMDWEEAARQMKAPSSIWNYVRSLINIRKRKEELVSGEMCLRELAPEVMEIERTLGKQRITAVINFSDKEVGIPVECGFRLILASEKNMKWGPENRVLLPGGSCVILEDKTGEVSSLDIGNFEAVL
ncbi:alpha-amylase family glycosyl hydrolase [Lacrimispora brassicae]